MSVVASPAVIWHDAECGSYDADLLLWRELAEEAGGPILEIGCGTGRVLLDLARRGHEVTGVDLEPELVATASERASERGLRVDVRVGDARDLALNPVFGLIVIPMQTIQLLGGKANRRPALTSAARCLAPGGTLAISIVEAVPEGDGETAQPLPDVAERDGWVYSSLPLDIIDQGDTILVTRLRQIVSPDGNLEETMDETRLWVLSAEQLEAEAREVGLVPANRRDVPTTKAHVGSTVVLLGGS
jgi:SAM-dependent methyltransferase